MNKLIILFVCFFAQILFFSQGLRSETYTVDYVVVGAGTAGCAVTKLLSDDRHNSVIAIHNGSFENSNPLIKFSKNAIITVGDSIIGPPFFINGVTPPQPFANNQELPWAVAIPEGGASAINAGAYCRGTRNLYDQWEAIAGPNWSFDRMISVYKSFEDYHGKTPDPQYRGYHGLLKILQVPKPSTISRKFSSALKLATGLPFVEDYNDPDTPIGVSPKLQYTQKGAGGEFRVSSGNAFLNHRIITRDGYGVNGRQLRIFFNSFALRTIWDGNTAIGVEYLADGIVQQVFARKAVVVCGGLFSSAFLMHSGVGPAALLQSLGIPVVFDNPNVGQNLVDQPHVPLIFETNPFDSNIKDTKIFEAISWLPDPTGDPLKRSLRLAFVNPLPGAVIGVLDILQPLSRGFIAINDADPTVPPIIDYGQFSNPADVQLYIIGMQTYVRGLNLALQALDPNYRMVVPDPAILDDLPALEQYIRSTGGTNLSLQSHCLMAPLNQGGVVDGTGKVYGVNKLYVADDSINPVGTDGCTMAEAYVVGANVALLLTGR